MPRNINPQNCLKLTKPQKLELQINYSTVFNVIKYVVIFVLECIALIIPNVDW